MPEGPEIRRAADQIAAAIKGRTLKNVVLTPPRLRRYQRRLAGTQVVAIETRGKAMLTRFNNDLTLYSHNQLYGRWYITDGNAPNTNRSLRVGLITDQAAAFLYSASDVELLNDQQLAMHPFLNRIGPDVLSTTPDVVLARLTSTTFHRRRLAALYLDQSFVAGLGNYLRSEILHAARLHPGRTPESLERAERRRLASQTYKIAERSYRTGGLTNPSTLTRRLRREGLSFEQRRFAAFARAGKPCYRCGARIERAQMGGRRVYFCARCQSEP